MILARPRRRVLPLFAALAAASIPDDAPAQPRPLTIVALGTSLTARGGWPLPLEAALERCLHRPVAVRVVARSGQDSTWGVSALDQVAAQRPDVVLVEFAVNDAALHHWIGFERSRRNMQAILDRLADLNPRPRVFVMAMNPVSGLRGALRPSLDRYAAMHRDVAQAAGAGFIDHGPAWRALAPDALARAIPDGTHPDPAVAARIMVPALVRTIAGEACAGPAP